MDSAIPAALRSRHFSGIWARTASTPADTRSTTPNRRTCSRFIEQRRHLIMTNPRAKSTGRVAVVTGAAAGIGQAFAVRLAEDGLDVAIADRNPAKETAALVEK